MNTGLGQSKIPDDLRIYAIGDVHGYLDLLEELLARISTDIKSNPVKDHRIVFLGDYIDRGPDSAGCVECLINLMAQDNKIICLKGNHELKLQNFLNDPVNIADSFFTYGGVECASSYKVDMAGFSHRTKEILQVCAELNDNIPIRHKQFFDELEITVSFGDYMFTHAGVRPGVALDQQSDHDLVHIRAEFISHQESYEKVIVHGHTPAYPMEILLNRINVDTWAYETGVLSCVVLEGKEHRVIHT